MLQSKAEVLLPSIIQILVLFSPAGIHGGAVDLSLLQVLWSSEQELCVQSGILHYNPVQGWIQKRAGYFHEIEIFWRSVFFNRDPCFFIMGCPIISKTIENMACPEMMSNCMETWITLRWVKMDRHHMYPSSLYYLFVFLYFLSFCSMKKKNLIVPEQQRMHASLHLLLYVAVHSILYACISVKPLFKSTLLEPWAFSTRIWHKGPFLFLSQSPSEYCAPYRYDRNDKPIVPCGSIANSMFNGMFENLMILHCLLVLCKTIFFSFF